MKTICLYLFLMTFSCLLVADDALIISDDGETIIVNDYSITNGTITFTTAEGEKDSVDRQEIFELLVRAKRNTDYKPVETRKHIAAVKRVFREFPGLRKQLQPLLDEWLRIRSQYKEMTPEKQAELKKEIDDQFKVYEKESFKEERDYLKLRQGLEMIRYRDLRGVFEKDITEKLSQLGNVLIVKKAEQIEKEIEEGKITMPAYKKIRGVVRRLLTYYPPNDVRIGLKELEDDAAKLCLKNELRLVWKRFSKDRSGFTYIKENAMISKLESEFSAIETTKERAQALRIKMQDALIMHFDFKNKSLPGYPLSKTDKKILGKTFKYCSSTSEPVTEPVAILFPTKPVTRLSVSQKNIVTLRAVLKEAPDKGLRLYFQPFNSVMRIKTPIKESGVDIRFSTGLITHMLETGKKDKRIREVKIYLAEGEENKPLSNPITFTLGR